TMSAPARHFAIIEGISSGGCCRSQSIGITARPRAWASPADSATSLPKLRASPITLIRPSWARAASSMPSVSSRLPSSTNTISHGSPSPSSTGVIAARNAARFLASLYAGAMIDTTGSMPEPCLSTLRSQHAGRGDHEALVGIARQGPVAAARPRQELEAGVARGAEPASDAAGRAAQVIDVDLEVGAAQRRRQDDRAGPGHAAAGDLAGPGVEPIRAPAADQEGLARQRGRSADELDREVEVIEPAGVAEPGAGP